MQLVTNLLSNYPNGVGLGQSEVFLSLIQHLLFCINVHSVNTGLQGAVNTTICFSLPVHTEVMLAHFHFIRGPTLHFGDLQ